MNGMFPRQVWRERHPCVPRVNTIIPTFPFIRSTPAEWSDLEKCLWRRHVNRVRRACVHRPPRSLPLSFSLIFSSFFFPRPRQPSAWLFKGRFGSRPRRRRRPRFIYRPSRLLPHSRVQRPIRLRNLALLEISSLLVPQSGT